jgi:hypothetical protein
VAGSVWPSVAAVPTVAHGSPRTGVLTVSLKAIGTVGRTVSVTVPGRLWAPRRMVATRFARARRRDGLTRGHHPGDRAAARSRTRADRRRGKSGAVRRFPGQRICERSPSWTADDGRGCAGEEPEPSKSRAVTFEDAVTDWRGLESFSFGDSPNSLTSLRRSCFPASRRQHARRPAMAPQPKSANGWSCSGIGRAITGHRDSGAYPTAVQRC